MKKLKLLILSAIVIMAFSMQQKTLGMEVDESTKQEYTPPSSLATPALDEENLEALITMHQDTNTEGEYNNLALQETTQLFDDGYTRPSNRIFCCLDKTNKNICCCTIFVSSLTLALLALSSYQLYTMVDDLDHSSAWPAVGLAWGCVSATMFWHKMVDHMFG